MEYKKRGTKWVITKANGANTALSLDEMVELKGILKYLIKIEIEEKNKSKKENKT